LSKVSTTLGLSSASIAASESEFSMSSSTTKSPSAAPSTFSLPSSSVAGLNGIAVAGATIGAGVCPSTGAPGISTPGKGAIG